MLSFLPPFANFKFERPQVFDAVDLVVGVERDAPAERDGGLAQRLSYRLLCRLMTIRCSSVDYDSAWKSPNETELSFKPWLVEVISEELEARPSAAVVGGSEALTQR